MSNEENTGTDGRLVLEFTTEVIAESERCKQDIANAYRVYENPNAAGGVIIYGLYHGKWCANVSGRSVVKYLLAANDELKKRQCPQPEYKVCEWIAKERDELVELRAELKVRLKAAEKRVAELEAERDRYKRELEKKGR